MANAVRIVAGVAGLAGAAWSAGRVIRARRRGHDASLAQPYLILAASAAVITATLLV